MRSTGSFLLSPSDSDRDIKADTRLSARLPTIDDVATALVSQINSSSNY